MSGVEWVTIGRHRLACGDCLEILPTLTGVDAVVTDPPYGIGFASQPTRHQRINGLKAEAWDDTSPDDAVRAVVRLSVPTVIWGGNYFSLPPSRGWLIWSKRGNAPSMADAEMAWTSRDANTRVYEKTVKSASLEKNLQSAAHPTQKPVGLMVFSIEYIGGQVVLDPFMGSGTTGVACERLGRSFIGIEKEPRYFDIACRRIEEATKSQPLFAGMEA